MRSYFLLLLMLIFILNLTANTAPVVSNISTAHREDGTMLVDIFYDVYDADGDTLSISMEVSGDDGASWNFTCDLVSGDIGDDILAGTNKHIIWDVGAEHPEIKYNDIRIRITADDGFPCASGTVMDVDGNVYQTLVIGDQEWMVENLKVIHYRNGDLIPHLTDSGEWTSTTNGAYCVSNNTPSNADTYGNLYNWYAVDDPRGLAPEGWHVPTDEEIIELEMYLGMTDIEAHNWGWRGTNEGSKLAGRADLWNDGELENDPEFGSSGFDLLPGGWRHYYHGDFSILGAYTILWSSTEYDSDYVWYRYLYCYSTEVTRYPEDKRAGFSVRCVKDSPIVGASNIFISSSGSGMSFSWSPVAGATSYKIYRGTDPYADVSEMEMVAEITETNWTDPEALEADCFFYRIVTVFPDE